MKKNYRQHKCTEELAHWEIIGTIVWRLAKDVAEEKARATYEYLIRISDDPGVNEALGFLRQREIVHFQRFGETLQIVQDEMNRKKYY